MLITKKMLTVPLIERFLNKIRIMKNGCWNFCGSKHGSGYGQVCFRTRRYPNRTLLAHRLAVVVFGRDLPVGAMACHTCDNKICVNPAHIHIADAKWNARDAFIKGRMYTPTTAQSRKGWKTSASNKLAQTRCKHGHRYTEDNIYLYQGHRNCRKCIKNNSIRHALKRAKKANA